MTVTRSSSGLAVGVVQSCPMVGDVSGNLGRSEQLAREAIAAGARLVLFPELSLTGYHLDLAHEEWFVLADDRLDGLRCVAAEAGVVVVVGAPVKHEGKRNLASVVLGAGEDRLAAKMHLHGAEADVFDAGEDVLVVDVDGIPVGFAICLDTAFASHAELVRDAGAAVYAASVIYTEGEERKQAVRMAARALDNGMAVVCANQGGLPCGSRSAGGSGVWDTTGGQVARVKGPDEEIVVALVQAVAAPGPSSMATVS